MSVPDHARDVRDVQTMDADLVQRFRMAQALDIQAAVAGCTGRRDLRDELLARADRIADEAQAEYDRRHPEAQRSMKSGGDV